MSIKRRVRKDGSPVYDVRLRDAAGRVYTRTFRTKKAAEAYQSREQADRSRGVWLDPANAATPFAELAAHWLASNPGKRPSGWARDETIIRVHLLPALGSGRSPRSPRPTSSGSSSAGRPAWRPGR